MNMMKYKGYVARIELDEEDRLFVGHLAGIDDIVGFHGTTVDELEEAFHESVENYLAISEKTGRPAQIPHSGEIVVHVPPEIQAAVTTAAQGLGKSVHEWVTEVLGRAANKSQSIHL